MKNYILPLLLSASLMLPLGAAADSHRNNHRQSNRTEQSGNRGNGNKGHNNGNRPGNGNNNGKPGNNNGRPGNNNYKPGNNKHDKDKHHDKHKPGNNHKPGGNHGNSFGRPGGSAPAPGYRPGPPTPPPGHGYRPSHGHNHPPRLGGMVKHAIGRGRYDRVWMVAPGQYAVRFYNNGRYYMQYIWPDTGRYGNPFQVVMAGPGEWYAYGNRNQWYYDDGNTLRISLNGSLLNPWTLIPSVELNLNF